MKSIDINIAGKFYKIKGNESEDIVKEAGIYVNEKISELTNNLNGKVMNPNMIITLASVNIGVDYVKLFSNMEELTDRLESVTIENETLKEEYSKLKNDLLNIQLEIEEYKKLFGKRDL
ncbi:MAG: cell division protein ZapA [Clostridia bacterium]|nr:cell division protein ZapA [Clostridia bacterium]